MIWGWGYSHTSLLMTPQSEITMKDSASDMQPAVTALIEWSKLNFMNINCKKSKEMIISDFFIIIIIERVLLKCC